MSPARLARFFYEGRHGYRVLPELRAAVVFTVQDVLADPPFSRLDLVSCRNLLIYLRPEAQAKVVSLFHFALREGGVLLLGSSETVGNADGRFELISKPERLYRHIGRSRPGELGFPIEPGEAARESPCAGPDAAGVAPGRTRRALPTAGDGDLCAGGGADQPQARVPLFLGTDRSLSARGAGRSPRTICSPWRATGMRTKLRSAIQQASQENVRDRRRRRPVEPRRRCAVSFSIAVQPVLSEGEELLLVCFVDEPTHEPKPGRPATPR